ncbi:free fatty acid receptor 2-like [Microcaecilia unicolor]|uniref:Free fatty acid receptor 2-like n=1 Tax=Microcaecilia unicolor TaxID=1415580 RepID=A0A6P7YZL2_9AMPH|nr:free fatty acid receptor 2-like [Microcaecilia unicolor]
MNLTFETPLVLSVYIITFLIGLPSNLLAFYTFSVNIHRKPTPVDILLLNLSVSDLLLLIFLPFKMVEAVADMKWPLPFFLCSLVVFVYFNSIYTSTLFLTAISVERYLGVAHPIQYKTNRKCKRTVMACAFIWIFSSLQCSFTYFIVQLVPSNRSDDLSCYADFTDDQLMYLLPYRLEVCLVLFCIPFIITIFCYINFIRILITMPKVSRRKKQKAIGLVAVTLSNFILCFAPYNISHIVGFIKKGSPPWRIYTLLLSTLNASLDPLLFYYSSTAIQGRLKKCIISISKRLNLTSYSWFCGQEKQNSTEMTDASD